MPAYTCAIFDLDGTLLNTLDDLAASTNYALAAHGLKPRTTDEVRRFVGNGIANLIRRAVPEGSSEELTEAVHATFDAYYATHSIVMTKPYPGICELIDTLRGAGMSLCVVSYKGDYAVGPLVEHFFGHVFDIAVGEREGIRRKPWPDTVLACMRACDARPQDCVLIGDSEVDVACAQAASIDCIGVTWGFRDIETLRQAGAICTCDNTQELESALMNHTIDG